MKTLLLFLLTATPLLAETASVWTTLDIQASTMADAVKAHNTGTLEELEHVVADEVTGLRRTPNLDSEMSASLDEIAKWSTATAHAAKDGDWKAAATDQDNFAQAVKTGEGLAARKKG